jgi:putative transposase
MSKNYQKKTSRSRRKVQELQGHAVQVQSSQGQARFQMILPMPELMRDVASAIEEAACRAGLLVIKGLIDEEVEQFAGPRYAHQDQRPGLRWGSEEGTIVFAGRKVALKRPRVRSRQGEEIPLRRYAALGQPTRMEQAVHPRILRRVSMRDYAGVLDEVCDGYGIDKSSVSRHWKAASAQQLRELMERKLDGLDIAVILIDGKEFGDFMVITALGVASDGRKHLLGLWPGATENSAVCGELLDELIERGLAADKKYLFVLDGSKALAKAVKAHFGDQVLIQRCRVHKARNILRHLPKSHHRLFGLKWKAVWNEGQYLEAKRQLQKVQSWLASVSEAAAASLAEAFDQLLTVHQLGLPSQLRRSLNSTNLIENVYSRAGDLTGRVHHWRNENMVWRWSGAVLLRAETGFQRLRGRQQMPVLMKALGRLVDSQKVAM